MLMAADYQHHQHMEDSVKDDENDTNMVIYEDNLNHK